MLKMKTIERPTASDLQKIEAPTNKIIERLKKQVLSRDSMNSTVAYSRMHNRHNRS